MTDPHAVDPTGATGPRPDAGQRTEPRTLVSEQNRPGGLLSRGTRVEVTYPSALDPADVVGILVDWAAVPAPYISVEREDDARAGQRIVVFTGPGVVIRPAGPRHPGLG